jgi:hypothetical protein
MDEDDQGQADDGAGLGPSARPPKVTEATKSSPAPARNIDIMSFRPCDQHCRQCSFVEPATGGTGPPGAAAELDLIRRIWSSYPDSGSFFYPRDIVTAAPLLPLM